MNFHATKALDGIHARPHRGFGGVELAFLLGVSALRHPRFREILQLVVASLGSNFEPKDASKYPSTGEDFLSRMGVSKKACLLKLVGSYLLWRNPGLLQVQNCRANTS